MIALTHESKFNRKNDKPMKISVIIPAYNEEANIADTIRAALAQDREDFEVIVVNNASTDKTVEIASQFPVKLVHETRKGLLWAREAGRKAATGEIIANIDADCLPDPDWLSRGHANFANGEIVAVTGPYDYYDAQPIFRTGSLVTQKVFYPFFNSFFQQLKKGAVLIGGNNFIRADIIEKAGGYNTSILFYGEDTDTAKRVASFGKVNFDRSLIMKTSARRFKAEGTLHLMLKYWFHFFRTIFSKNKPLG